jgi:hypothetical protein
VARRTGPENLFSEAKGQHGLSRAHYRGLANMEQQALLTATVQNLKRYLQAETRVISGAAALRAALPALPSTLLRSFRRLSRSFLLLKIWFCLHSHSHFKYSSFSIVNIQF